MAKRKHKAETPLPLLLTQQQVSKRKLVSILLAGRAHVYADIQRRAKDMTQSGSARERVLAGVGSHYDHMAVELDQWTDELAYSTGTKFFERAKQDMGTATSVTKYSREYVERWLRLVHEKNAPSLVAVHASGKMRAVDIGAVRAAVISTLQEAAVTGMTARTTQREMQRRVEALTTGKGLPSFEFISKDGKHWSEGNYFNMLNRTLSSMVARESYIDAMTEDGFDLATIEGGGTPCPVCASWRGVVVSVTGADKDFPSIADAKDDGVFHPNCCCEARAINTTTEAHIIAQQRGLPMPHRPAKGDTEWAAYTQSVRDSGAVRPYNRVTDAPDAMQAASATTDGMLRRVAREGRAA